MIPFYVLIVAALSCAHGQDVIVNTPLGSVLGSRIPVLNATVDTFFGIPYAKPPTGDTRYGRAEPAEPFTETWNATEFRSVCPQPTDSGRVLGSEDCLYLNVWVPTGATNASVMVWIHGGAYYFWSGSDEQFNPQVLSTYGVIVVTINYRLGPLGFLYLRTEGAAGNQGLWDQNLALRWVRDNIAAFGGNPQSVTLFGNSAGGASTSIHILSPYSQGLFQRAIMQSGSRNSPWSARSPDDMLSISRSVARDVGCTSDDAAEVLACMKTADVANITDAQLPYYQIVGHYAFVPVVDGDFLPDEPLELIDQGRFDNLSVMVGDTSQEGATWCTGDLPQFYNGTTESPLTREQLREVVTLTLTNTSTEYQDEVALKYIDLNDVDNGTKNRDYGVTPRGSLLVEPTSIFTSSVIVLRASAGGCPG